VDAFFSGIAFPGARVDFNPSDGPFSFQKIFGDSDFFAAGVMKIPVGGRKPNKPSKENTFVSACPFLVDFDTGKL
jgi:centromere protein C